MLPPHSRETSSSDVIVRLQGGLGNQLFQYAAGRALSAKLGGALFLDLGRLTRVMEGVTQRAFELGAYPVKVAFCDRWQRRMLNFYDSRVGRLVRRLDAAPFGYRYRREVHFDFDETFFDGRRSTILDGYWQSEQYFDFIATDLKAELTFKEGLSEDGRALQTKMQSCNSVSLHFRRGDYLSNTTAAATHPVCGLEYYKAALRFIREEVEKPVFFLFSDDPDWVAANIDLEMPHHLISGVKGLTHHHELHLMSRCRHHIIANSSFSWWGAWLAEGEGKRVIAPRRWFNDDRSTATLIPKDWTRI